MVITDIAEGDGLDALTAKQRDVLDLLIQHKTSKEISRLLGISPHTVDQRIMLARAKLNVSTRAGIAQAYRKLLNDQTISSVYEQPVYGFSHVASSLPDVQVPDRDDTEAGPPGLLFRDGSPAMVRPDGQFQAEPYVHVLPEMFDGPNGTLLRLGAIALITMFLMLIVMGGLAMFTQLSQIVDR